MSMNSVETTPFTSCGVTARAHAPGSRLVQAAAWGAFEAVIAQRADETAFRGARALRRIRKPHPAAGWLSSGAVVCAAFAAIDEGARLHDWSRRAERP